MVTVDLTLSETIEQYGRFLSFNIFAGKIEARLDSFLLRVG